MRAASPSFLHSPAPPCPLHPAYDLIHSCALLTFCMDKSALGSRG